MIQTIFLGTSSMVPTKERNVSSILVNFHEELILFDCGEGTQRQMNIANINRNRIKKIFISHWHGDHVAGLIGLIQTLGNQLNQKQENTKNKKKIEYDDDEIYDEKPELEIYGPIGTKEHMKHLLKSCVFDNKVDITIKEFECKELTQIYENDEYVVNAIDLFHKTPSLAYSLIEKDVIKINKEYLTKNKIPEGPHLRKLKDGLDTQYKEKVIKAKDATYLVKGKKLTIVMDTGMCNNAIKIAENSDLLICESTYHSELKEKADSFAHLTSKDAAIIADKSKSQKLILTHISQRYKSCDELQQEAQLIFKNTLCAFDFMKVKL